VAADTPVLYHIEVSHYNEKARWALDYKQVPHKRRAPPPMLHTLWAFALARGKTFPVLVLNGQAIGDSTRIIEALERQFPDPPLYPADENERRHALKLEDFFDEELGPHLRRVAFPMSWTPAYRSRQRFQTRAESFAPRFARQTRSRVGHSGFATTFARRASSLVERRHPPRWTGSNRSFSRAAIWWAIASRSRT
jgi:glutathione S-transferase